MAIALILTATVLRRPRETKILPPSRMITLVLDNNGENFVVGNPIEVSIGVLSSEEENAQIRLQMIWSSENEVVFDKSEDVFLPKNLPKTVKFKIENYRTERVMPGEYKICVQLLVENLLLLENHQMISLAPLVDVGRLAPDFTTTDVNGAPFRLSDWRGKVVLLEIFTPTASIEENQVQEFKSLLENYPEIKIVSVSSENEEVVRAFKETHRPNWVYISSPEVVEMYTYGPVLPAIYLIDSEGIVRQKNFGYLHCSVILAWLQLL
ncbi:MAG: redoxin domain-containing protein [Candidatus Hadarchaeales archaeon]